MNQQQASEESSTDVLVDAIKEKLESLPSLSTKCCIYRVPERLRKFNPEAYSPRVVSIGPFHHGIEEFEAMEEHKLRYLQSFLPRTTLSIEDLVRIARTWEQKARNCYAETLKLSCDDFVMILIVDGSFLVELFLRSKFRHLIREDDRIFKKPKMIDDVCHDLILLENQLPGFVVKDMFGLLSDYFQQQMPPVLDIIHNHFECFLSMNGFPRGMCNSEPGHFVDLLRSFYIPLFPNGLQKYVVKLDNAPAAWELHNAPAAWELHNAGVRFKPEKTSGCSLDISFTNGILSTPRIIIDDLTETLYRNIIAFEQCHCSDKYFIHYALLLSCFIKDTTDANLLIGKGILVNRLGNAEDISRLFNSICKEVIFGDSFYFQTLSENLHAYCNTPWNKWKVTLRRDYFKTPWSAASVFAAFAILILLSYRLYALSWPCEYQRLLHLMGHHLVGKET